MQYGDLRRFLRFVLVGVVNTLVHAAVLISLVEIAGWTPPFANATAFSCAQLSAFWGHSLYTFHQTPTLSRYPRFLIISGMGVVFSYVISLLGVIKNWHYLCAFLFQLFVLPIATFLLLKHFAFSR